MDGADLLHLDLIHLVGLSVFPVVSLLQFGDHELRDGAEEEEDAAEEADEIGGLHKGRPEQVLVQDCFEDSGALHECLLHLHEILY